jgi:outer membrane receptor protein involved in Fe transport
MYLGFLGGLRGTANPIVLQLGNDPTLGVNRGTVQFATSPLALSQSNGGPEWLVRVDHNLSDAHQLAFRYIRDSHTDAPVTVYFPGFITDQTLGNQNSLFTDHFRFSSSWTNEFRFSYGRQAVNGPEQISPRSVPEANTFPALSIGHASLAAPGVRSDFIQARSTNNLLFQEAQTKLSGRHTFRYGVEFLKQLASQRPSAVYNGRITYTDAPGYSAFANFLDDFSGPSGTIQKDFGATVFYPNQLHQTYYFQDNWLVAPNLTVTLGLRYENFGQVANALKYPAFAGFDPANFLTPNRVSPDNKDFGPAFGLAWSPSFDSGLLSRLFGRAKTVWRGGYQISYDPLFTQALSSLLASSSPNSISTLVIAPGSERGSPNWFEALPTSAAVPSLLDSQRGALEKNYRNSYTERWSFGFQRQLSSKLLLDGSYIGSESHRLATFADLNYRQLNGQRLYPDFGQREIRASEGNSSYHAMQWRADRRFTGGFQANASYTWSRNIDSTSEGIGTINVQEPTTMNVTSIPEPLGGMKLDRGPSDYDRTHRFTAAYIWNVPVPGDHLWKHTLDGWSISGITTFQSGAPFTVANGFDRNNDGILQDRADIGNPKAPLNTRGVVTPASGSLACATGYRNPDTGLCVSPSDVHWIEGKGLPNASTVGRNTLKTGGIGNFDLGLTKLFAIGEGRRLEFRWEAFNALNHPQFTSVPAFNVVSAPPGRFLNRDFTNSGIRTMWAQVRVVF